MSEEHHLVGYWNGDLNNWRISKIREEESDILVSVELEEIPIPSLASKEQKLSRSVKRVSRELRGFIKDLNKIK